MKLARKRLDLTLAFLIVLYAASAHADGARPAALREVGIDQKLGESLPLDLMLSDESGKSVRLGDFFGQKPVLLSLAYYHCPMLCPLVLESLVRSLRPLSWNAGEEFQVLTVSIDPKETSAQAAVRKRALVADYDRPQGASGWHFLVGDAEAIRRLTEAIGFHYKYEAESGEYAHATALFVLTPEGKISRVLYGIDHTPRDVRLAMVEASGNQIGTLADQLLLFCYHYDPATGKYGAATMTSVRIGGLLTLGGLAAFVIANLRRESPRPQA